MNTYIHKGDRLYVSGRLLYRSYENGDGQKRQQVEIHAQEVVFLDARPLSAEAQSDQFAPDEDLPF